MDEITQMNTARILKFLQPFMLDFNNYSIWNYSRKKFKDFASTRPQIADAIIYLEGTGYIEKSSKEGYYRLTTKGKMFESWDLEMIEETRKEVIKPIQKSWISWLSPGKKVSESV